MILHFDPLLKIWQELQRQLDSKGLKVKKEVIQDGTFITADPGHAKADKPRGAEAKTRKKRQYRCDYSKHAQIRMERSGNYKLIEVLDNIIIQNEAKKENIKKIKFYVSLQGNKKPEEFIRLAKFIENLGFDRIYVYDDLMYYSSTQILTLIAEHTKKIEIGPCLVNGVYRHPAIIAQEAVFLEEIAPGRSVLEWDVELFSIFIIWMILKNTLENWQRKQ